MSSVKSNYKKLEMLMPIDLWARVTTWRMSSTPPRQMDVAIEDLVSLALDLLDEKNGVQHVPSPAAPKEDERVQEAASTGALVFTEDGKLMAEVQGGTVDLGEDQLEKNREENEKSHAEALAEIHAQEIEEEQEVTKTNRRFKLPPRKTSAPNVDGPVISVLTPSDAMIAAFEKFAGEIKETIKTLEAQCVERFETIESNAEKIKESFTDLRIRLGDQ